MFRTLAPLRITCDRIFPSPYPFIPVVLILTLVLGSPIDPFSPSVAGLSRYYPGGRNILPFHGRCQIQVRPGRGAFEFFESDLFK